MGHHRRAPRGRVDYHNGGGVDMRSQIAPYNCYIPPPVMASDNGNVNQIGNQLDSTRTQNFVYDSLNRIQQASTSGPAWGEIYTIDPWGNLTNRNPVTGKSTYEILSAAPAPNNQLTGFGYDAAGNMLNDALTTYTYDAENRVTTASNMQQGTWTYTYDGDGERVKKTNGSTGTLYWTGAGSDNLAESDLSGNITEEYVFFNGERVARVDRPSNLPHFYFGDQLGSARATASVVGDSVTTAVQDFYPYGGLVGGDSDPSNRYKFTGKERDSESGLDMFGARYYGSSLGRFMTPDYQVDDEPPDAVPNGSLSNPQTLNLYGYVQNNPVSKIDPDGHASWGPCANDPNGNCFNGDYNGERDCSGSAGCLFWNGQTHEWQANDPTAPNPSNLPAWWVTGFMRLALNDPYGLKQMGYAYGKLALLPFGGWNLLKPPGVNTGSTGTSQAGGRPSIVPDNWIEKDTYKQNGKIYIDPNNPHNRVRVMDDGYMKVQRNGQCLDVNGNEVPSN
jgi:RHS repeat-associated protein